MIEFIRGKIAVLNPAEVVLDTGGVGYLLNISLGVYGTLQQSGAQTEVCLLVHEIIREDAQILYGFLEEREREMFRQLISVSGIGANTARLILSAIPARDLEYTITGGDHARLKAVKGIGAKTAERIIVDLRDKIKPIGDVGVMTAMGMAGAGEAFEEALAALVMLGFPRPQSQKVLRRIFDADSTVKVELAVKQALSMM